MFNGDMAKRSKRIVIISEFFFPDDTATGYIMTRLAVGLSELYDVLVLCGPSRQSGTSKLPADSVSHERAIVVQRSSGTGFDKNWMVSRSVNFFTISISLFVNAVQSIRKGDKVIVVTNPPSLPYLVALACRFRRADCLLLIHDVYPEVLSVTGMIKSTSILARAIEGCNQWLYRNVDKIIVLGRDMQRLVLKKVGGPDKRVMLIPNWADVDQIAPESKKTNSLLTKLRLHNKFIVQYSGNFGRTHDVESILQAARLLSGNEHVHFLLAGTGAKREWVARQLDDAWSHNVTLLQPFPRHELTVLLNACDVAVVSFIPGMSGISVPSRMYNIFAAGKPIIALADEDSEISQLIREERIGWVIPPGNIPSLQKVILEAQHNPNLLQEMGHRARFLAQECYSFHHVIQLYRQALKIS